MNGDKLSNRVLWTILVGVSTGVAVVLARKVAEYAYLQMTGFNPPEKGLPVITGLLEKSGKSVARSATAKVPGLNFV